MFFRYGFSDGTGPGNPAAGKETFATGIVITDVFGQNNNVIGVGCASGRHDCTGSAAPVDLNENGNIDVDLNAVAPGLLNERQYCAEAFYRIQVTDEIQITPSVQLFRNPILNVTDAFFALFGLRSCIDF